MYMGLEQDDNILDAYISVFFRQLSENRYPDTDEYISFAILAWSGFKKSLANGGMFAVAKVFQPFLNILHGHGEWLVPNSVSSLYQSKVANSDFKWRVIFIEKMI